MLRVEVTCKVSDENGVVCESVLNTLSEDNKWETVVSNFIYDFRTCTKDAITAIDKSQDPAEDVDV